jgi:endonuclease/exonuclease/phosphatase family metal-dependent hydrolase
MKIATWNVNEFVGITTDLDNQETTETVNKANIEEMISILNVNDFDIVCFQEYPAYVDGVEMISKQITEQTHLKYYCNHSTYGSYLFSGGQVGVAIFSKYKIADKELALFGNPDMTKTSSSGIVYHSFDKGIIRVGVEIQGKKYNIITGHAMAFAPFGKTEFDYPESYKPLEEIIKKYSNSNLVVAGDFNTEKLFDLIPGIRGVVKNIINEPTTKDYYEKRGAVQMDYILINKDLQSKQVSKIDNFSDHYVMCAEIN